MSGFLPLTTLFTDTIPRALLLSVCQTYIYSSFPSLSLYIFLHSVFLLLAKPQMQSDAVILYLHWFISGSNKSIRAFNLANIAVARLLICSTTSYHCPYRFNISQGITSRSSSLTSDAFWKSNFNLIGGISVEFGSELRSKDIDFIIIIIITQTKKEIINQRCRKL